MYTYILFPLLFFPVYLYKRKMHKRITLSYDRVCTGEYIFTYKYEMNKGLSLFKDININEYEHYVIDDPVNKEMKIFVTKNSLKQDVKDYFIKNNILLQ